MRPATPNLDEMERLRVEAEAKGQKPKFPKPDDPEIRDEVDALADYYQARIERGAEGDPGDFRSISDLPYTHRRMVKQAGPMRAKRLAEEAAKAAPSVTEAPPPASVPAPGVRIPTELPPTRAELREGKRQARAQLTAERLKVLDDKEQSIKALLDKMRRGKLTAGIDPEELPLLIQYGMVKLEKGAVRFEDWAARMLEELGDWVRPQLARVWEQVQKETTPPEAPGVVVPKVAQPAARPVRVPTEAQPRVSVEGRVNPAGPGPQTPEAEAITNFSNKVVKTEFVPDVEEGEAAVRTTTSQRVPVEDVQDLVNQSILDALEYAPFKAAQTAEEKEKILWGFLRNKKKSYFREKAVERGTPGAKGGYRDVYGIWRGGKRGGEKVPLERVVGQEGEEGVQEVVSTTTQEALGRPPQKTTGEGGERNKGVVAERGESWKQQAQHVQQAVERKFQKGYDSFDGYLRERPARDIFGIGLVEGNPEAKVLRNDLDTARAQLHIFHLASAMSEPTPEILKAFAKENGISGAFDKSHISRLRRVYNSLIEKDPQLKLPAERVQPELAPDLPKVQAELRQPTLFFGLDTGPEGKLKLDFAPGARGAETFKPGQTYEVPEVQRGGAVLPEEEGVRRAAGRELVETTEARVTGEDGTWINFSRADTPRGSRIADVVEGEGEYEIVPRYTTSIRIGKTNSKSPEALAEVFRQLLEANPKLTIIIRPLERESAGSRGLNVTTVRRGATKAWPGTVDVVPTTRSVRGEPIVNPNLDRALAILEKEGLFREKKVVLAEEGPVGKPPLLPAGSGEGVPVPKYAGKGGVYQIGQEVEKLRAEAKRLRAGAAGKKVTSLAGEAPIVSTVRMQGGELAVKRAERLEKEADILYAQYRKQLEAGVKAQRADQLMAEKDAYANKLAERWVWGEEGPLPRKPVAKVYERVGGESAAKRALANSALVPDERLGSDLVQLRKADDLDEIDRALEVGGGRFANIDGVHDPDTLRRVAEAHAPLMAGMRGVGDEIAHLLGLDAGVEGAMGSPTRHALVVGEGEGERIAGRGKIYLNPQHALYRAEVEGTGLRGAAENLVNEQILHELAHLERQSVLHGDPFEASLSRMLEKVKAAEEEYAGWVGRLSNEQAWEGLRREAANYRRLVEETNGGRGGVRRAEGGVGGVRAGAPQGRLAATPDRGFEGAPGTEAGGGAGVRAGQPVPEGAGGQASAVGEAAPGGPGADLVGGGRTSGRVAEGGAGGGGEGARQVAYSKRPQTIQEYRDAIGEMYTAKGPVDKLMEEAWSLSFGGARQLMIAAQAGDPDAVRQVERAMFAAPTGKGETWSRINNHWRSLPEETKVAISLWSDITKKNPELSRQFSADTPADFAKVSEEAKQVFDLNTPADLHRKLRSGKRLTLLDVELARVMTTDLIAQAHEAERRWLEAVAESGRLTGEAQQRFVEDVLPGVERERGDALSRLNIIPEVLNATQTTTARMLAIHKQMVYALEPKLQMQQKLQEFLRQSLGNKYRDKNDLNKVVGELMAVYRDRVEKPDWMDQGVKDFWEAVQKAHKYSRLDQLLEAFKGGLLGYTSRVANLTSNSAYYGLKQVEKNVAGMLDQAVAKAQGVEPERFVQEAMLGRMALRRAMHGALPAWKKAQVDAFALRPLEMTGRLISDEIMEDFMRFPGAIGGKPGEFFRFMFKGMNADDAMFKHISKVDSYYREAYRSLKRGVSGWEIRPGETIWEATERYVDDMEKGISAYLDQGKRLDPKYVPIYERAKELAAQETFQEKLPAWAAGIQAILHRPGGKLGQFVFPFVKTPTNIAREALRRTPLDWYNVVSNWGEMSRGERADAAARHLTAAAITAGLYAMVEGSGLEISGNGPLDPEANQLMKESGWQPYSIKVGDKWYSYQRLEPVGSILGMIADVMEGQKAGDFEKVETGVARTLGAVTQNVTSKTFLTGLEGLTNLTSDPIRYAGQWAKGTAAGFVPNTVGFVPLGHLARQIDPVYREVGLDSSIILNKLPWLSQTLPPQYAPTGEERKRPDTLGPRVLSPIAVSTEKKSPEGRAARMLADIGFPMRRVRPTVLYKGMKVDISREDQKALAQAQQKALAFIGARLMNDPTFQALPNNEEEASYPGQKTKKDVLARIVRKFRDPVMTKLGPELRGRAAQKLKAREERVGAGA